MTALLCGTPNVCFCNSYLDSDDFLKLGLFHVSQEQMENEIYFP